MSLSSCLSRLALTICASIEEEEQNSDFQEEDPPIIIDNGRIELGPFLYQYLSLAIDPNPRKAGASFGEKEAESDDGMAMTDVGRLRPLPC